MPIELHGTYWTVEEVAAELNRQPTSIRALARRKDLGVMVGNVRLLTDEEVDVIRLAVEAGPGRPASPA